MNNNFGDLFMWIIYSLISLVAASLMQILIKKTLTNLDPIVLNIYRNFILGLFSIGLVFYKDTKFKIFSLNKKDLIYILLVGLCTFIAFTFYMLASKHGNIKNVVAIDKLSVVLVVILSAIFLQEKITFNVIIGSVFMVLGVLILVLK